VTEQSRGSATQKVSRMHKGERIFSAVFGLFLLSIALYVLVLGETPAAWRFIGGAVLAVLGANMLYASYTGKRSWLSRVGPLP
jgi:hypothetical protein